jgi:putative tryptophan/tyrosine transport system substrate-binding protein
MAQRCPLRKAPQGSTAPRRNIFSRESFLFLVWSIPCLLLSAGCSKAKTGMPVIGFLQVNSGSVLVTGREGFLKALADEGFVDGKTVHVVVKDAQGDLPTLQAAARDLVSQHPRLIGTASTPACQAALNATTEVPIVFTLITDALLVGAGESAEKHRPNVTGLSAYLPVSNGLKLLHEIMPGARTVGTLYDPGEAYSEKYLETGRKTAGELGLQWVEIAATNSTEIVPGIQALKARGVEAIMQIPTNMVYEGIEGAIKQAGNLGIPVFAVEIGQVQKGAVAAVGLDMWQWGYDAGKIAARVLRGENPAGIPFQYVKKELLFVNPQAAANFKITLPPAVLKRADKVIGQKES